MAQFLQTTRGKLDSALRCGVCKEIFQNPRVFCNCQHTYCLRCIVNLISAAMREDKEFLTCPICRATSNKKVHDFKSIPKTEWSVHFPKNFVAEDVVSNIVLARNDCQIHREEECRYFCKEHLVFCCNDCLWDGHRLCKDAKVIVRLREVSTDTEYIDMLRNKVEGELNQLQVEMFECVDKLFAASQKRKLALARLKECQRHLQAVINLLENKEQRTEIQKQTYEQTFKTEVKDLQKGIENSKCLFKIINSHAAIRQLREQSLDKLKESSQDILSPVDTKKTLIDLKSSVRKEIGMIERDHSTETKPHEQEFTKRQNNFTEAEEFRLLKNHATEKKLEPRHIKRSSTEITRQKSKPNSKEQKKKNNHKRQQKPSLKERLCMYAERPKSSAT